MRTFPTILIGLLIAHLLGCSSASLPVTPNAAMFDGKVGGCSNFSIHRYNKAKTWGVYIVVDETSLDLNNGPVTLDVDPSPPRKPFVQVFRFAKPVKEYFCDDVVDDPEPVATWNAVSGQVTVQDGLTTQPQAPGMYVVTVTIHDVVLKCVETGETATIDVLEFKDVLVGWFPG